jgi:hypothetical protein
MPASGADVDAGGVMRIGRAGRGSLGTPAVRGPGGFYLISPTSGGDEEVWTEDAGRGVLGLCVCGWEGTV